MTGALSGRVALVTGASRGVGLGVAIELGTAGATVHVTGRSTDQTGGTERLDGTIDSAARAVDAAGGRGVGVVVDHREDRQVLRLAQLIRKQSGGLDLLVNNVWAGYEDYDPRDFSMPMDRQPIERWDRMFDV